MLVQVSRLELTICKSPDLRTNFLFKNKRMLVQVFRLELAICSSPDERAKALSNLSHITPPICQ